MNNHFTPPKKNTDFGFQMYSLISCYQLLMSFALPHLIWGVGKIYFQYIWDR